MDGEFGEGVVDDMISVVPEVFDLFWGRRWEGNDCTQSAIGIPFGYLYFIKPITIYGFQIILFDVGLDGAGISGEVFEGDFSG
jgi:hypothetical protein